MNENMYFVSYTRHNASTDGWAYKTELASNDIYEAKKAYHALLGEYIKKEPFDFVSAMLYDKFNNVIEHEYWSKDTGVVVEEA